jgi:hypothetical protein
MVVLRRRTLGTGSPEVTAAGAAAAGAAGAAGAVGTVGAAGTVKVALGPAGTDACVGDAVKGVLVCDVRGLVPVQSLGLTGLSGAILACVLD